MVSSCEVEKKALHGWVEIAKLSTQSIIRTSSEDGRASGCGSGRICGSETEVESLAPGAKAASIRTCFRHCASSMRAARTPQDCSSSFLFLLFVLFPPLVVQVGKRLELDFAIGLPWRKRLKPGFASFVELCCHLSHSDALSHIG